MGFYFRVAPGVRVRLTGRGVRTSLGPRAARVHLGAGGTGVSTGAGPISYYHRLPGAPSPSPRRHSSTGQRTRALDTATKADRAEQISRSIEAILALHREDFPPAQRPHAARPTVPNRKDVIRRREKEAASRYCFFRFRARRTARERGRSAALAEHADLVSAAEAEQARQQHTIDEHWEHLLAGDPDTVLATLAAALEDNDAESAPVGIDDDVASVVVRVPDAETLPKRIPGTTAAGNVSLRKANKTQWNSLYALMISGYVVVTAKEVLATAPSVREVSVVAVRETPPDAYGERRPEALLAARFTRETLEGVRWDQADALQVVTDASVEYVLERKGVAREIRALVPKEHPDVAAAIGVIDMEEAPATR